MTDKRREGETRGWVRVIRDLEYEPGLSTYDEPPTSGIDATTDGSRVPQATASEPAETKEAESAMRAMEAIGRGDPVYTVGPTRIVMGPCGARAERVGSADGAPAQIVAMDAQSVMFDVTVADLPRRKPHVVDDDVTPTGVQYDSRACPARDTCDLLLCTVDVGLEPSGKRLWLRPEDVRGYVEELRAEIARLRKERRVVILRTDGGPIE